MLQRTRHIMSHRAKRRLAEFLNARGLSYAALQKDKAANPFDSIFLSQIISSEVVLDLDDISRPSVQGGAFWGLLWAMAGSRETPILKRVTYRVGDQSFSMLLDLNEAPECGYLFRNPTPLLTRLLMRRGSVFLDIGANVGFHALTAGLFFSKVFAFEPTPNTFSALQRNIDLSNATNVKAIQLALSDKNGNAVLNQNPKNRGANRIGEEGDSSSRCIVPIETLDSWVDQQKCGPITFIKLDVEGHEVRVLSGASHVLEDRPAIFSEISSVEAAKSIVQTLPEDYVPYDTMALTPISRSAYKLMMRYRDVFFLSPQSTFRL